MFFRGLPLPLLTGSKLVVIVTLDPLIVVDESFIIKQSDDLLDSLVLDIRSSGM